MRTNRTGAFCSLENGANPCDTKSKSRVKGDFHARFCEGEEVKFLCSTRLYRTGGDAKTAIVLYEYQPDRRAKRPAEFLKGFKGYLHTDGYAAYHTGLGEGVIVVG
jgi:hypothetical protein